MATTTLLPLCFIAVMLLGVIIALIPKLEEGADRVRVDSPFSKRVYYVVEVRTTMAIAVAAELVVLAVACGIVS